jgi:aminopeptidase N
MNVMKTFDSFLACRIGFALLLLPIISAQSASKPDETDRQIYAPSRRIDILHLALDVTPDFRLRSLTGTATMRFKPIAQPLEELRLDGVNLNVSNVTSSETLLGWQATAKQVIVTFAGGIPAGKETVVTVRYSATPEQGMYFRTPELGYRAEDMHVFTQGESITSRHWFPCLDSPNEKYTSEVTCHVPVGMVALSNGRLISEDKDPSTGLVAVHWLQDKPHSSYLIALAAGYFKKVEGRHRDLPLAFYVPVSEADQAANSFADTAAMIDFYEREIGVPYPWAKYDQVCVQDFVAGGMENTTLTILNTGTLHTKDFENLRDSHSLVAHELVHQWFGDYVTCKDWANVWLNEGFATYYEELYEGERLGRDEFLYRLSRSAQGILAHTGETNAIVRRDFNDPDEQFSYLAYPKGGWVLHMIRCELGDDLYRRCIKTYLERHALGTVVTEDLNQVLEELSGRTFDRFFDQWVFHAGQPELNIDYNWDERTKLARVSVQQVQKVSDRVMLFQFPLPVRFKTKAGIVNCLAQVKDQSEEFYFALPSAPDVVRIDPGLTVLAKINFNPPRSMLDAQLADPSDILGRLMAVDKLGGKPEALGKLKDRLNQDPHYGVRLAAARGLRAIHSDDALDALIASVAQADARVRRQVVGDIAGFYQTKAYTALREIAQYEKNPDIRATIIRALGAYPQADVRETLLAALKSESYHQVLAEAAIAAMRAQDDASYVPPILEILRPTPLAFSTWGYSRGLNSLGWLERNEATKDTVREFLLSQLQNKREGVRLGAIEALEKLGDPKAIAALETWTSGPPETREYSAAEKAVAALHDTRKPSVELGALRSEVMGLQKENRELRQEVNSLKRQFETLSSRLPTNTSPTPPQAKPPKNPGRTSKPRK